MFGIKMSTTHWLSSLGFLLSFIHIAFSIHCFQCNSNDAPECARLFPNDTRSIHYKACDLREPHQPPFCRKSELKLLMEFEAGPPHTRIIRACGYKKDTRDRGCYKKSDRDHEEIHCQCFTDGCNSSDSNHPNFLNIATLSLTSFIFSWYRYI